MKILYIEDDIETVNFIKSFLDTNYFTIDSETDGEKGLSKASMNNYDLIIVDINIPKISGLDICKKLRQSKNNTPIIFLTSSKEDEISLQAFENGCDDYIQKPFNKNLLLARIEAVLRRPKDQYIKQVIKFENIKLDTTSKKLFIKNNSINLSKKEFGILELLMRNQNKIISKDEIFDKVWDSNDMPISNTVEVCIKNLRKKIKTIFKEEIIKTIKGLGYYTGKGN